MHQTVAERMRPAFPALRREIAGRPVAYFDGPGGTQVPESVVAAMNDYLLYHNANDGWAYASSAETDAALAKARALAATFVAAGSADEILFGNNMTTLTFAIARAFGRTLRRGDEIIVTDLDHHANIDPWLALERDYGAVVKRVPLVDRQPLLDLASFERLLGPRTRLVAIGLSSNAFGTLNPVADMAQSAHRSGALVFVDAVHAAAHAALDVGALGADMLAFSAYKVYGPHVGVAYVRDELLDRFDFPRVAPQAAHGPKRAESGTLNHEGIVGTGAALQFLADAGAPGTGSPRDRLNASMDSLAHDEEVLFRALISGLRALPNVTLYEPPIGVPRHPTVAFTVRDRAAADVAAHLSTDCGIFVSHGDFYAATAVREVASDAIDGVVRAGIGLYTTADEVDRLVDAVGTLATGAELTAPATASARGLATQRAE